MRSAARVPCAYGVVFRGTYGRGSVHGTSAKGEWRAGRGACVRWKIGGLRARETSKILIYD